MGLDIYLYPADAAVANQLRDQASEAFYGRPDYDSLTEEQRTELRKAIPARVPQRDVPSQRYPEHLFNRRYLRSSYNAGGFNSAVPDFVGEDHDLYWIFEPMGREWDGDDGALTTSDVAALQECRKRAEQVAGELAAAEPLRVMSATGVLGDREHMWHALPTEAEVLAWYREERAKNAAREAGSLFGDGGYSCAKGAVLGFEKGVEVLGVTVCQDLFGRPAAALVYRPDRETLNDYVQSAEIVVEFIDEAISLIERDGSARMTWSG